MAGSSYTNNQSTGSGYSTSTPTQTPQSEWGMQLSQLLTALSQNQYKWAMDQFNNGQGITDQNINHFMELSGKGAGLAQNLLSRYTDVFEPLMNQYIQQAGSYASEGRQRFMAGQAESTVAQADQQARDEAERKLQGFGINPNSGRYQDLLMTSRIQDAAARAGAGTQASLNTADRGRQMLERGAAMGQNVPGMTVNALQSAYTGVTGAENAILGMLNTGANLSNTVAPLANAASGAIKMPTNATNAKNQNQSTGLSRSSQSDPAKSSGGDKGQHQPQGDSGSGKQAGPSNANGQPGAINPKTISNPYSQPNPGQIKTDDGTGGDVESPYIQDNGNVQPYFSPDLARDANGTLLSPETTPWDQAPQVSNWTPPKTPSFDPASPGDFNTGGGPTPQLGPSTPQPADQNDPWGDNITGGTSNSPGGALDQGQYQQPRNPFQDASQWDPQTFAPQPQSPDYGGGNYQPAQTSDSGGGNYQQPQSPDYGGGNYNGGNYQQPPQDTSASDDNSQSSDYGEYARGGQVRQRQGVLPTSGGHVSRQASPSRGRQTDDVPARLNAGEFVVPRDVVAHKGSEFFQKLIAGSRKARTGMSGAPARGQMKPSLPNMHRPSFVSRPMGGR